MDQPRGMKQVSIRPFTPDWYDLGARGKRKARWDRRPRCITRIPPSPTHSADFAGRECDEKMSGLDPRKRFAHRKRIPSGSFGSTKGVNEDAVRRKEGKAGHQSVRENL
jgi:hypothetical protein